MPTWLENSPNVTGRSVVLAEDVSAGEFGSVNANGEGVLACAFAGIEELPCFGIYEIDGEAGDLVELKVEGFVQDMVGLTPGGLVYASNTPGSYSVTAGNTSCIIGKAWSETVMELCLEQVAGQHVAAS